MQTTATQITGRITGGAHGWPFAAATFDLDACGYVEEEWGLTGAAQLFRHRAGTDRSFDGRWQAEPSGSAPYRTRLLVRRPADPDRFNGTVVLFWNNVSLGFDLLAGESPEIYDGGFAFVGVSTQRNGVHGYPGGASPGLTIWDPARYGSLSLPSDGAAYDIFTQAATVVGRERPRGSNDPLAGLDVRHILALGASQSANWLATYLNAIQPLTQAIDGFLLDIYFGNGSPLEVSPSVAGRLATPKEIPDAVTKMPPGAHLLRDDLDVPVFVLNSETEATGYYPVRQPDSEHFRHWEVAGHAHGSRRRGTERLPSNWPRDLGTEESPMGTPADANILTMEPVRSAALQHFQRWLVDGTPPPRQPPIEFDIEERGPVIRRDHLGVALGGVRLPDVDVPTACHRGVARDGTLVLTGSTTPFSDEMLRALYPTRQVYRERYQRATAAAVEAGVLLAADADRMVAALG
ncbi:MAG: alpha/beta hydrolase domain-containing protein [Acidimicrobiales bacterium]